MTTVTAAVGAAALVSSFVLSTILQRYRAKIRYPRKCKVVRLFIYPVKGFKTIEMTSAIALPRGFEGDRRFMVVKEDGSFLTQRENSRMATVSCKFHSLDQVLELSHEDLGLIFVSNWAVGPRKEVRVWRDTLGNAIDQGDSVAQWISTALDLPGLRLVYMADDVHRPVNPKTIEGHEVSFADGFPYLVASTSSLKDLNDKIGGPEDIPITRFRPNIVVEGLFPWLEDKVGTIIHFPNGQSMQFVKPCDRCKVTTINQDSGEISLSQEPLKTMRTFRRIMNDTGVYFATNAVVFGESKNGKPIQVGDEVDIEWFPNSD